MSLINFTQINDGDEASDTLFNTRFGQIVNEVNGNLDQDNIKDASITTAKIVDGAVTTAKLPNNAVTSAKIEAQQQWIAVTAFQNGWVNYGSGWEETAYYKDSLGIVHLKGFVKNGTAGTTILTLPAGYRTGTSSHVVTCSSTGYAVLNFFNDGRINLNSGGTGWLSLSYMNFKADA